MDNKMYQTNIYQYLQVMILLTFYNKNQDVTFSPQAPFLREMLWFIQISTISMTLLLKKYPKFGLN